MADEETYENETIHIANDADLKDSILDFMRSKEVTSAAVEYSGEGDSGSIDDTTLYRTGTLDFQPVPYEVSHEEYTSWDDFPVNGNLVTKHWDSDNYGWVSTPFPGETIKFSRVLDTYCYSKLPGGWEINDGSRGTIYFNVVENKIELTHNSFFTDVDTTITEW